MNMLFFCSLLFSAVCASYRALGPGGICLDLCSWVLPWLVAILTPQLSHTRSQILQKSLLGAFESNQPAESMLIPRSLVVERECHWLLVLSVLFPCMWKIYDSKAKVSTASSSWPCLLEANCCSKSEVLWFWEIHDGFFLFLKSHVKFPNAPPTQPKNKENTRLSFILSFSIPIFSCAQDGSGSLKPILNAVWHPGQVTSESHGHIDEQTVTNTHT